MAEQLVKLFGKEIQKNLFPDNAFYKHSRLDGGINVNAKTVQIPQAGSVQSVITNPSSFPITVETRTDDVKEYNVDLIATAPVHIEDVNLMVINYDKRKDIIQDQSMVLNTRIADLMAYAWSPASGARVLETTGATRPSSYGGAAKKKVTYSDIVALNTAMTKEEIPLTGRYLAVSAEMYADLLEVDQFISFDYKDKAVASGAIGTILGFTVYVRSKMALYDATATIKGIDDAGAVTDKDSILAWHESFVRRAEGNIKVYADTNKPEYLGSLYNAAVRTGGMVGRLDSKGTFVLTQADFV